ncbi:MAG: hypothetical protein ACHQK8_02610 [Bacteroidia bacterium]
MIRVYIFFTFFLFGISISNAQFLKGTRVIGASFSASVTSQDQTENSNSNPFRVTTSSAFNQIYTVNFPYGIFIKDNYLVTVGINYSFDQQTSHSNTSDTNGTSFGNSKTLSNTFGLSGKIYRFYEVKKKFGVYHSEGINLSYSYATGSSENLSVNGIKIYTNNIPASSAMLTASFDVGIYYQVIEQLILSVELNLFNLNASYAWSSGTDSWNRPLTTSKLNIGMSGTLTPSSNLTILSVGMKYLFLPKNKK